MAFELKQSMKLVQQLVMTPQLQQAIKLLQQAQKRDLDENQINAEMVKVLVDKSQYQEAAELALELIDYKRAAQNPQVNEGGESNIYGPFE